MNAPNPQCVLCDGTGLMQSESYDGKPLVPCRCTDSDVRSGQAADAPADSDAPEGATIFTRRDLMPDAQVGDEARAAEVVESLERRDGMRMGRHAKSVLAARIVAALRDERRRALERAAEIADCDEIGDAASAIGALMKDGA